jgi:hypothetical protein
MGQKVSLVSVHFKISSDQPSIFILVTPLFVRLLLFLILFFTATAEVAVNEFV